MTHVDNKTLAIIALSIALVPVLAGALFTKQEPPGTPGESLPPIEIELPGNMTLAGPLDVYVANESLRVVLADNTVRSIVLNETLRTYIVNDLLNVMLADNTVRSIILNDTLKAIITNDTLRVQLLGVALCNVTNEPSVFVKNASLNVNVSNTPLPVTMSTPVRYYYIAHTGTSAVGANKVHLLVWNSGTRPIYITRIIVASEITATVTGFQIVLRVVRASGYSGGTSLTIAPFDTNNPSLTGVVALTNPTITVMHTLFSISINQEETGGDVYRDIQLDDSPIVINPNQGIAIQQYGTAGVGNVAVSILFYTTP